MEDLPDHPRLPNLQPTNKLKKDKPKKSTYSRIVPNKSTAMAPGADVTAPPRQQQPRIRLAASGLVFHGQNIGLD